MSVATPPSDPEVAAEQVALDHALTSLRAMRLRAEQLLADLLAAGNPDLDYKAALARRVALLADSPRPLLFGRIDEVESGPSWRIGRRHVEDEHSDPVVIDWRAPVAVPFYRASAKDALGLARRRQIMVDRDSVMAVADDLFGGPGEESSTTRLRGGDALLAELERARTGEMLDIVATIQAEQDEIIRAPLDQLLTVQGGPGTGKTAVGLHRAAFLLYNHPGLSRDGVLVLGPSRAFLRYIAQVLPALGEEAVVQTTIGDIAPKAKVRVEEPMEIRRIKGDPRMGELLRRALHARRRPLEEDVRLRVRFARATLGRERINDLVASIVARPGPYKSGRLALRARLVSEARSACSVPRVVSVPTRPGSKVSSPLPRNSGRSSTRCGRRSPPRRWSATFFVRAGNSSASASGLFSPDEWQPLLRSRGSTVSSTAWSADDLALLDEAAFLIGGRSRSYGHIVVDEAQDLTPMQFRMIARRAPSGSITMLGDLAQATGPWTYADWDEIRAHLPDVAVPQHDELTLGYRAPGRVPRFRLAASACRRPGGRAHLVHTAGRTDPTVRTVRESELASAALDEAARLTGDHALVALVVPEDLVAEVTRQARRDTQVGVLERDAMSRPVTIVPAPAAKGLEFDAVVVVEPAAIAGDDRRGLRLLYVAMTRPIQHLSVVHAQPLPSPLLG